MKKEIILQEDDFNYLKENSDSWLKYKKDKTRFIKFHITLDRRHYGIKDFEMLIDDEVPESLKIYLENFKEDIRFQISSLEERQLEIENLKTDLTKIPNWIKLIFK